MRSRDLGISTAYFEAVAPTYEEAKEKALDGIRLSGRDVKLKEVDSGGEGVKVRAISVRTRLDEAKRDLKIFLDGLGIDGEITGREEAGVIFLDVDGEYLGLLIGRGGVTLEATEYLLNVIHNRRFTPYRHVILDIGAYRRSDIQYIESLLERAGQHIANRGGPFRLPPMSSKKRKLSHLMLRKYPGLMSKSIGEEPERCVEVMKAPEVTGEMPYDGGESDREADGEGESLN